MPVIFCKKDLSGCSLKQNNLCQGTSWCEPRRPVGIKMNKEKFLNWIDRTVKDFDLSAEAHGRFGFEACTFIVKKNLLLLIKLMIEEGQFDE